MEFRRTTTEDVSEIMEIVRQAQSSLKSRGVDQWQNGYPNEDIFELDINHGESYVLKDEDKVIATVAVSFSGEETYDVIYEGEWLSNNRYAVVHRIAVHEDYKGEGIGTIIFENIEVLCQGENIKSIKVDTHEDNISMQRLLSKNGFVNCGYILLFDGSKRIAFEKVFE